MESWIKSNSIVQIYATIEVRGTFSTPDEQIIIRDHKKCKSKSNTSKNNSWEKFLGICFVVKINETYTRLDVSDI